MASFRSSSHCLMIEVGWYYGIDREERHCPYCECVVEDELHFLLVCPLYSVLRSRYIEDRYYLDPSIHNMQLLMSSKNETLLRNLACFIYYALKEKHDYLEVYA